MTKEARPKAPLLQEFLALPYKSNRCLVCYEVPAEVRAFIEEAVRAGRGPISISKFLHSKGLWEWSAEPIRGHSERHMG